MLTDDCKDELASFKADAATNVNKNLPLAVACAQDAATLCGDADPADPGAVLACLLERRGELTVPACSDQVFVVARDASSDWRVDPDLRDACASDVPTVCPDADPGNGDVLACLRDAADQVDSRVSVACAEQLFRQAVENADDVRLDARVARARARATAPPSAPPPPPATRAWRRVWRRAGTTPTFLRGAGPRLKP